MLAMAIFLLAAYIMPHPSALCRYASTFIQKWGLELAFGLSFVGAVLTLFYSEVLGYIPCGLCWMGRVFLYPQVILFAVALWTRDRSIALYSIALSAIGFVIASYTHYLQMGGSALIPCPASGAGDCAKRYVFEFGFVTMPMMGVALFALLIMLMLHMRRTSDDR